MKYDVEILTKSHVKKYVSITEDTFIPYENKISYGTSIMSESHGKGMVLGVSENGMLWFKMEKDDGASFWDDIQSLNDFNANKITIISNPIIHHPEKRDPKNPGSLKSITAKYIKEHQAQIGAQIKNPDLQNNLGFYSNSYRTLQANGIFPSNAPVLFKVLIPYIREEKLTNQISQLRDEVKFLKKGLKNTHREFSKMQLLLFKQNEQILEKLSQIKKDQPVQEEIKKNIFK